MKWLSTKEFARLIEDHFPANEQTVREWCEGGDIPAEIAKRNPAKKKAQWFIKVAGIRWILETFLQMSDKEIQGVQEKAPVNFNRKSA